MVSYGQAEGPPWQATPARPAAEGFDWSPFVKLFQACLQDCKNGKELTPERLQQRFSKISAQKLGTKSPQASGSSIDAEVAKASGKIKALRHTADELDAALHRRTSEITRTARNLQVIYVHELPAAEAELEAAQAKQRAQADSAQESARAPGQLAAPSTPAEVPPLVAKTRRYLMHLELKC